MGDVVIDSATQSFQGRCAGFGFGCVGSDTARGVQDSGPAVAQAGGGDLLELSFITESGG